MDPKQALESLDQQIISKANGTRADHAMAQQMVQTIAAALDELAQRQNKEKQEKQGAARGD